MRNTAREAGGAGAEGAVAIEMPRLSNDEGAATLSAWLVAEGDVVEKGAIVAELETDKATVELEAPVDGRIAALVVRAGTEGLKPGVVLGRIVPAASAVGKKDAAGSKTSPARPIQPTANSPAESTPVERTASRPESGGTASDAPASEERVSGLDLPSPARSPATPLARRVAAERGIALEAVVGTGLGGRIEKADIERTVSAPGRATALAALGTQVAPIASTAPAASIAPITPAAPHSGPRPSVALALHCLANALVAARVRLGGAAEGGEASAKISLNDLVLRAAALALRDVPAANLRRGPTGVELAPAVDLGLVVATERGPRIVVVRDADRKGLIALSGELRSQIDAARRGEPSTSPEGPVSLLVTSFARFGIETAHPMVPEDQVCVLAVGALREEPIAENGSIHAAQRMSLTLAFDPNAVGGGTMAELLAGLRRRLEDPLGWLL